MKRYIVFDSIGRKIGSFNSYRDAFMHRYTHGEPGWWIKGYERVKYGRK